MVLSDHVVVRKGEHCQSVGAMWSLTSGIDKRLTCTSRCRVRVKIPQRRCVIISYTQKEAAIEMG